MLVIVLLISSRKATGELGDIMDIPLVNPISDVIWPLFLLSWSVTYPRKKRNDGGKHLGSDRHEWYKISVSAPRMRIRLVIGVIRVEGEE